MSTLSCSEIRERIADGVATDDERAHARGCAECRPIVAALGEIDEALAATRGEIDAPDALVAATLERVAREASVSNENVSNENVTSESAGDPAMTTQTNAAVSNENVSNENVSNENVSNENVTNENRARGEEVGSGSLLEAALGVLMSALGALFYAPLTLLRWLGGVGTEKRTDAAPSIEDRGKTPTEPKKGFGIAPVFALGTLLVGIIGFSTFQRFGSTVKTKTRGAEGVVNGLPTVSADESDNGSFGWWENDEPPAAIAPAQPAFAVTDEETRSAEDWRNARVPEAPAATTPPTDPAVLLALDTSGSLDVDGDDDWLEANLDAVPAQQATQHGGAYRGDLGPAAVDGLFETTTVAPHEAQGQPAPTPSRTIAGLDQEVLGGERTGEGTEIDQTLARDQQQIATERAPAGRPSGDTLTADLPVTGGRHRLTVDRSELEGERGLEVDGRFADTSRWDALQTTTGLAFASSEGWWANTYVPGDAQLRILHTRLAASHGTVPGTTLTALALAEGASPTTPAVAAPTDRAIALGVHADTTAIEAPTRVRVEVALRGIDQAAGRRSALRIALVVDARHTLDEASAAHLRALFTALSRQLTPRDRVIVTAAGDAGGTLVPLGVLRHGEVEVAVRHLTEIRPMGGEVIPVSIEDALAAGLEAVSHEDDGAGLALLVTPDAAHAPSMEQALHLGAVAGVPTTAVGIGAGASTEGLDAIALAGEGRRRLVLSDDDATRAVREEIGAASRLVARALRVRVRLADGVSLVGIEGSHALDTEETRRTRESERAIDREMARRLGIAQDRDEDDSGIRISIPAFYAGDAHTIVLDLLVTRPGAVADVDVRFKDLVRLGNGTASSALSLEAGHVARGPRELRVVASLLGQRTASALDRAGDALERGDVITAQRTIADARALIDQARVVLPGLSSVSTTTGDAALLDRFAAALGAPSDPGLVAASLHYAAARRVVTPQLAVLEP
jgi:hypothetical protein